MCGISGILLGSHEASPTRLEAIAGMTAALYHRGPDDEGFWVDQHAGIALGHRRLAIVDLSEAGHQPMVSETGRLVISYNGEIYNFQELRAELEARGSRFQGHSDTEVMLTAFETWGLEPALRRFAGMFAFALWDRRNRVLHLARDRLGKKPLYIALTRGVLAVASELKALRTLSSFDWEVDQASLALVLRHGWLPDQCCIWKGVFKLPPGTVISVSPDRLCAQGGEALLESARPWWSLADIAARGQAAPLQASDAELEEELDRLLRKAVSQRMVADVPIGAFLSGGIDSSTVVSLMQAQSSRPIQTFTVGFAEPGYDEASDASEIARYLGTDHRQFRLTPEDAAAVIPDLPRIWDEPFAAESQVATFLMSRLARESVTVALSGDGGDECFGGYARHFTSDRLQWILRTPAALRSAMAAGLGRLRPEILHRLVSGLPGTGASGTRFAAESLGKLGRILPAVDEGDLYLRLISLGASTTALLDCPEIVGGEPQLSDALSRMVFRDMSLYLRGNALVKLDRATMACSLEGRSPLLDHRLIEFSWQLPSSMKVRHGRGKWLLRRVLRRYLPETVLERPKAGFNVPVGRWLRGPLRDWAETLLSEPRLRQQGLLDASRVQALWRDHLRGQSDRGCELWAILVVQGWLDAQHDVARADGPALQPKTVHAGTHNRESDLRQHFGDRAEIYYGTR